MKTFIVGMVEVHIQYIKVDAKNKKQAIELVKEGNGDYLDCEYSHVMASDKWIVNEETKK